VQPVVNGGGAEIPQDRLGAARQQREAAQLVALPLADLGAGQIADVVDVKAQQRAGFRRIQRLPGTTEPIAVEPRKVDPLLEVDRRGSQGGQRAVPPIVRIDVLGANFLDGLVHGPPPSTARGIIAHSRTDPKRLLR